MSFSVKEWLRSSISPQQFRKIRKTYRNALSLLYADDLNRLALIQSTDKWNFHWYTQHYQKHFSDRKYDKLNILEIGIGGYDRPEDGGDSLRMWNAYFHNATIHGMDIYDKSAHASKRIKIHRGSQVDEAFLENLVKEIGPLDIIIDDGSHINEHVITTFKLMFKHLKDGGIYAIEDTQTSYWENFGGDYHNLDKPGTMLNFFKSITDCLNVADYDKSRTEFDNKITSMHFYHNLIFIYKGDNSKM
ncbi:MAG: Mycinamicin 2-O-methyltransferase [Bacteroidota bacterium]|nr:Mycinamicin 2-O-methyltransferase [Bacteroidota bacterium]